MFLTESQAEFKKLLKAIEMIQNSSKENLKSIEFVEKIIEVAGRTKDKRPVYVDGSYQGIGSLHQKPAELARALIYLSEKQISSYIEIGCSKGSTAALTTSYLNKFNPIRGIGIDIKERKSWKKIESLFKNLKFYTDNSNKFNNYKFDLCFIDGDHSFEWVKKDFENVGKFSKYCMFHDIYDKYCPEVGNFYNKEIKGINSVEFSTQPYDTMGIGILTL